ncbi:MAG: hypothetical protein HZA90_03975 [Verrucomicrobia bacterium]|nr:hypothetical protein [Verrucomicrobiota bacterium]
MTSSEAKLALLPYRPGALDATEPEMAEALALTQQDAELGRWFEEHCAYQDAVRRKFRSLMPPADLKERILAERKIVRPQFSWQKPAVWIAVAAVILLFAGLAVMLTRPAAPDRFADYRARMVRVALREYRMDIVTNDMTQVRQFMAQRGAPADYEVPAGLGRTKLTGGGLLKWRGNPVSMVCFDRGDKQMLYLFVLDRTVVKDAPPASPQVTKVNKLVTASWTQGDKTYVLAGPEEPEFTKKYL